jgi:proteasome accessory factor C
MAMVPWVASQGAVTIDEVCERFAVPRAQLLRDLEVLSFVCADVRNAGTNLEASFDDEYLAITPQWFDRPPALTPLQALALLAASEALLDVPGADPEGPLARALGKVEASLGLRRSTQYDADLGAIDPALVDVVRPAIDNARQIAIRYYSSGNDQVSERVIEPWVLRSTEQNWYVVAYCTSAGGRRTFRVDRIVSATALDTAASEPRDTDLAITDTPLFQPGAGAVDVVLVVAADKVWATERWPAEERTTLDDGSVRVRLAVSSRAWLQRILLQLGPAVTVESTTDDLAVDRSATARRLLAKYRR